MVKSLSIVVPTYHEAENLPLLMDRIAQSLSNTNLQWEAIVVDDNSQDATVAVCKELSKKYPLRLIVRTTARGLASAVVAGMKAADSTFLMCLDADLSHPPEAIPAMIQTLSQSGCDFVIGSRYVAGGTTADDWGLFRWLNSFVATGLARPLTSAQDPLAGFFVLRRENFEKAYESLDAVGYKIGLELIVKCHCQDVREVPIHFSDRQFGESKLSLKEQLNYLRHLKKLYSYRWPEFSRFVQFGIVGLSGVGVNLLALSLLVQWAVVTPWAIAAAIWIAMTWNFFLNRKLTFQDCSTGKFTAEYLRFCAASLTGAVLNWSIATSLWKTVALFSNAPTMAGLVGIVAGMALNFTLCRRFVFLKKFANQNESSPAKEEDVASSVRTA